jgi:hypothetical protein
MGLGHVGDNRQVMFPTATGTLSLYSKGDLTGLDRLGAGAGACTGTEPESYRVSVSSPTGTGSSEPGREVVLP